MMTASFPEMTRKEHYDAMTLERSTQESELVF